MVMAIVTFVNLSNSIQESAIEKILESKQPIRSAIDSNEMLSSRQHGGEEAASSAGGRITRPRLSYLRHGKTAPVFGGVGESMATTTTTTRGKDKSKPQLDKNGIRDYDHLHVSLHDDYDGNDDDGLKWWIYPLAIWLFLEGCYIEWCRQCQTATVRGGGRQLRLTSSHHYNQVR
jgi:hypothetical protein